MDNSLNSREAYSLFKVLDNADKGTRGLDEDKRDRVLKRAVFQWNVDNERTLDLDHIISEWVYIDEFLNGKK